jgi:hexulose-6-phosphate isomerase
MYKALNYWVFGGFTGARSPFEFIDFAAEQRLDGVELTVGDALKPDITDAECRRIAEYAAKKNIGLRTLASGFYWGCSLGSPEEAERRRAIEFTENYLRIAAAIGAESILVVPGATQVVWDPSRPVVPYRQVWEQSTKSLTALAPLAEKLQINIALENVWNRFLLSPMEWKFYLEQFDTERIGLYFDAGNCCLFARPQDYPEILGRRIKAVHLKNFSGSDCAGGLHGFGDDLLQGDVDFPALFAAFEQIGYDGPFTVEMIPFSRLPDMTLPDQALAEATARKLRGL